jgi:hypothetical protein
MSDKTLPKVGCLAWGSLEWDPRTLKVNLPWQHDGPTLPVEYLRQSLKGHLTLVLAEIGAPVITLWTTMTVANLSEGVESLRFRERSATFERLKGALNQTNEIMSLTS